MPIDFADYHRISLLLGIQAMEDIRARIIDAFRDPFPPKRDKISGATYDDEGTAQLFGDRNWNEFSVEVLRTNSCALSFFTPEAFQYFLPAFMLAELDNPTEADVIAESVAFHFVYRGAELIQCLSAKKKEAVLLFLEECRSRYPSFEVFSDAIEVLKGA